MAQLIAAGTTEVTGSEFTLLDGQSVTLNLYVADTAANYVGADARATVQAKTSAGGFLNIGALTAAQPVQALPGPGVFRVVRHACAVATGVDKS